MSREPSRERPILFSAPMVRAILAGTKTQTRRAVKPQPVESYSVLGDVRETRGWSWPMSDGQHLPCPGDAMLARCPYGEPGDRLWVRETFCTMIVNDWPNPVGPIGYRADGNLEHNPGCWRPSIHMARRHSRITLEITCVRVERLQEISEADAMDEGCRPAPMSMTGVYCGADVLAASAREYRDAYRLLWEQINGSDSWDANPWVWVLEFRTLERQ